MDYKYLEGMPLGDVIQIIAMEEPETEISLAAASGYVAIDTAKRLIPRLNKLSMDTLLAQHKIRNRNYEHIINTVTKAGSCPEIKVMEKYITSMVIAENKIRRFVPFAKRMVKEIRPRFCGGVAVFVDGDENGRLWVKADA